MGRIGKLKRQIISEANKRLLNEIADIKVIEPEMLGNTKSMDRGLNLRCVKIDYDDPKNSIVGESGPYPWDLVEYDKDARPVRLFLYREGKPRDVSWGDSEGYEMSIGFEEITDPYLRSLFELDKKYIMTTTHSPKITGEQFCRVSGSMDKDWDDNFFSLNETVIEPFPNFSRVNG